MADGRTRRPKGKKGPTVGSGGNNRRRLEGKGPTPKAEDRVYHKAYKAKKLAEARAAQEAARKAARTPKLRSELKLRPDHELIAGRNPVAEAVRSGIPLSRVFMLASAIGDERLEQTVRTATALGTPMVEVSRTELDRMTNNAVHQGVAIEVPPYEYKELADLTDRASRNRSGSQREPLLIALDSVTDPHNLGAVLRAGAAFDADGVIIPERRAAGVNATTWKVSAGAVAMLPVARVTNLVQSLQQLKKDGYFVVGLDGGADVEIGKLTITDVPLVVVTGSEGKGLARLTRETCDVIASIPMNPRMESLNAAVATGISLYQIDQLRSAQENGATENGATENGA